jgi:ParB family chromosome partitioning protein
VKWQPSDGEEVFLAFNRRADEGTLSRLLVETTILVAVARSNVANVLRDAENLYKVDTDAIGQKVKQKFAANANKEATPLPKAKKAA